MRQKNILDLEIRRTIFNYIKDNPGLHLRDIARKLKINYHNLRYHIRYLEKNDFIIVKNNDSYSRVFVKNDIGNLEKEVFNIARKQTSRNILLGIIYHVACSQKKLSLMLEKHPTTIEYHLKKLINLGLIEKARTKDGKTYTNLPDCESINRIPKNNETWYILKDPRTVILLFWNYRKSLSRDKIFRIVFKQYVYDHRYITKNKIKMGRGFDYYLDFYTEIFFDIFPHPYHV